MTTNIFTAALTGMNAAQYEIATTEHNISNASTPGYSRQQVLLSPAVAQQFGSGFLGQGVDITGVRRIYDQFLTSQVLQVQTQASYLSTYNTSISQIDNMFSNPTSGISTAMQNLFNGMNGVANNPGDTPSRQAFLGSAQTVVNSFQTIDQQLTSIATGLNGQINDSVTNINSYARQIAALNSSIQLATSGGLAGQQPNDLLDQRDQLINQLNQIIQTSTVKQSDGSVSVFIGNGQALVMGNQSITLKAVPSASDPTKLDIAYQANTATITLQQSDLQGGSLGALLNFRDQSLEPARNALGRVAIGLAASFNQQNQLGQDLNGALGANLFNVAVPQVTPNANNTGTASVTGTITDVSGLTTSNYRLQYDGANYSMLRLSDNTVTNLGAGPLSPSAAVDGFTVSITSGAMAAGDSFVIRPTANGARDIALLTGDPASIAAAAPINGSAALANTGSGTISSGTVNPPPPVTPDPAHPLTDLNLQQPVSIAFNNPPTTYNVTGTGTGNPTNVPYTPGSSISYNGWTVQLSGTPASGDVFNVATNTNAVGDNRNALLMAGMQTQNLMANGTASLGALYSQLVGDVGSKAQEIGATSQAQDNLVTQTVASQQSVSGVNLDEEAANLIQFQNAYQAAAKALQIATTMFDTLLSIGK
ncbi:MAG: flagellar hook-associated protein FlgK [Gallionella sp.]